MNSVKLYSNGTAVISRDYPLSEKETKISIPVKKSDLDDVVASLSVFGNVSLPVPPSYTPVNANATPLQIDPASATRDLATKLAGSDVAVEVGGKSVTGKLVGIQTYQVETNNTVIDKFRLVVLTDRGVCNFDESEVTALKFTDASVQAEIDKALQRSFQAIKPDSSFIDLTIVPNEGEKSATVVYAIPVAAWKIRYQLRFLKGVAELEGQAVVDNDTDDDWSEAIISVITGEPITFSTDLAEIRRPARSRVNVVSSKAAGAVQVEDAMPVRAKAAVARSAQFALASAAGGGLESVEACAFDAESYGGTMPASMPPVVQQAEVRESGDFSVFTSPTPVSVGAKKSAIIPMFTARLDNAETVLFYKEQEDNRRPYRAVKLTNETLHALGKGVCEVFVDGDFQGKCILEATKPGEEVILVHAKETGVKIFKEHKGIESRRVAIKIKDGVAVCETLSRMEISYRVQNSKPEDFTLEIEHHRTLGNFVIEASCESSEVTQRDIPSGSRLSAKLSANGTLEILVIETQFQSQSFSLGRGGAAWLQQNVIAVKNPLSRNKKVQECIELQGKADDIQAKIDEAEEQYQAILDEQERLQKLIPNAHSDQANAWRTELATNEAQLRTLRETIPQLQRELRAALAAVQDALKSLSATWSDKKNEEPAAAKAE